MEQRVPVVLTAANDDGLHGKEIPFQFLFDR